MATTAAPAPYSHVFPLDHGRAPSGYWLVAKGGRGTVVTQSHLPAEGQGFLYYWLGHEPGQANYRLTSAMAKLRVPVVVGKAYDVSKAKDGPWELPSPKKGLAALLAGVDMIPVPGIAVGALTADAAATAETGGAGATASGAAGGAAAAGGGASVLKTAADAGVAASLLALIADPKLWIRVVEITGGVALLLMGLKALTGGAVDPVGAASRLVP